MSKKAVSNQLIIKLSLTLLSLLILVGASYIVIALYYSSRYFEETNQKLNKDLAAHLIEEKFQQVPPFLENGEVNKALFGDLMHDMMAVNRGIEVYLLDDEGIVLFSVVLNHEKASLDVRKVDVDPINTFVTTEGEARVLGDDPRNPELKKIFSAAPYNYKGKEGFVYIILASKIYDDISESLSASYFLRLGAGAVLITIIFALFVGVLAIIYLTKNLRKVIYTVQRFKEGDMGARVHLSKNNELSVLADTFDEMAFTIEQNIEEIKSLGILKQELIANISHDLRSPLTVMHGYIETLLIKNKKLSEEQKEMFLNTALRSTNKLSKLVNQLFEYSKLESNQITPEKQSFQLTELASDLYSSFKLLASNKNIKLESEITENTPLVFGDIELIERVVQNLMDNALKFTPDNGAIKLRIDYSDKNVLLEIFNSGSGISIEDQSFIFERHRQVSSGAGAGLGLAIVKKILELHNATIDVISAPNKGATFEVQLPIMV